MVESKTQSLLPLKPFTRDPGREEDCDVDLSLVDELSIKYKEMLGMTVSRGGFATAKEITQKTFQIFTQKYAANLAAFQKHVASTAEKGQAVRRSTQRAYVHPIHEPTKPVFLGVANALRTDSELRGPQQVSPHYQHFSMARRHALIFMGGLIALRFIASTEDFYVFGTTGTYAWTMYYGYNYFWVEGKKFFLMPMLSRFYRKLLNMELTNMETYWAENTEARVRNLMSTAKGQLEYKSIHGSYLSIRNNSLLNFLIAQQLSLKNHVHARAQNILKEVELIQKINQDKIINSVMQETLASIDTAYKNNKQAIEKAMFELALEGIAQGKMDYAKDPILPHVVDTINNIVGKFDKISKADQEKMVALSDQQLQAIRKADARARDEYVNNQPKIDGSLRNNPTVAKVLASWGN